MVKNKYQSETLLRHLLKEAGFRRQGMYMRRTRNDLLDRIQMGRSPWYKCLDVALLIGPESNEEAIMHETGHPIPDLKRWIRVSAQLEELNDEDRLYIAQVHQSIQRWFDRFNSMSELIEYVRAGDLQHSDANRSLRELVVKK